MLLRLHRASRTVPAHDFKDAALAALRPQLDFDSALWGTFVVSEARITVHAFHLHNLPVRMMQDYEAVKQHDPLNRRGIEHPGHTSMIALGAAKDTLHPKLVAYVRRYDLEHALATVWLDEDLKIYTAISLYRGRAKRPFTERDRKRKQALVPHLVDTWNANATQHLSDRMHTASEMPRARALIDRKGMIYSAEADFAGMMREEFPDWSGPVIPPRALAPLAEARGDAYRGDAIQISVLRDNGDGLLLVVARKLCGVDRLSPRELSVATEFAAGRTYKEIAAALGIAPATVRNQLQVAYAKLGVDSKIALAKSLADSG